MFLLTNSKTMMILRNIYESARRSRRSGEAGRARAETHWTPSPPTARPCMPNSASSPPSSPNSRTRLRVAEVPPPQHIHRRLGGTSRSVGSSMRRSGKVLRACRRARAAAVGSANVRTSHARLRHTNRRTDNPISPARPPAGSSCGPPDHKVRQSHTHLAVDIAPTSSSGVIAARRVGTRRPSANLSGCAAGLRQFEVRHRSEPHVMIRQIHAKRQIFTACPHDTRHLLTALQRICNFPIT
ncbi:MAG: hypothetical protein JWN00_4528 [Actinomycetia bacterium]|nr:hypothetical protein [Actinomycetes bacterium]